MKTHTLMTAVTIAQSASATVPATAVPGIILREVADDGIFSIYLLTTGTGVIKVEYLLSHDESTYLEPADADDIVTGFTVGSGIYSFQPEIAPYMRLKVTEDGTAEVVVTLILTVA